jgi:hypothetical protein
MLNVEPAPPDPEMSVPTVPVKGVGLVALAVIPGPIAPLETETTVSTFAATEP